MLKFKRQINGIPVTVYFDGKPIQAARGDSVAAALLQLGVGCTRKTPKLGQSRMPYCLTGHCFDCLMVINGIANQQACLVIVEENMIIERQEIIPGSDWA